MSIPGKGNHPFNRKLNCPSNRKRERNCPSNWKRKLNSPSNRKLNCKSNRKLNLNCPSNRKLTCPSNWKRKINCPSNRKRKLNCPSNRKLFRMAEFNPWAGNLDDLHLWCCPQCDFKAKTKDLLINHGIYQHQKVLKGITVWFRRVKRISLAWHFCSFVPNQSEKGWLE